MIITLGGREGRFPALYRNREALSKSRLMLRYLSRTPSLVRLAARAHREHCLRTQNAGRLNQIHPANRGIIRKCSARDACFNHTRLQNLLYMVHGMTTAPLSGCI